MSVANRLLIDTINATGGITTDHKGAFVPVADEDWTDLAHAYFVACEEEDVEPTIHVHLSARRFQP